MATQQRSPRRRRHGDEGSGDAQLGGELQKNSRGLPAGNSSDGRVIDRGDRLFGLIELLERDGAYQLDLRLWARGGSSPVPTPKELRFSLAEAELVAAAITDLLETAFDATDAPTEVNQDGEGQS